MRGRTSIFCALGCLLGVVVGPNVSLAAQQPLDETYVKPGSSSWGERFRRLFEFERRDFDKSFALVIGVGDYQKDWRKLEAPPTDARRVRNFLKDAGFDYVITLTDSKATKERIEKLMEEDFPKLVGKNDRFLFYYSGHGTQRTVGGGTTGYLPLSKSGEDSFSTMISMDQIARWDGLLGEAKQTLFLLDSCFSGLAGVEVKGGSWKDKTVERLSQYGHHLITAGTEGEESVASKRLWNGSLFTDAFLRGAAGQADAASGEFPTDGVVSLKELVTYISQRIDFESTRVKQANLFSKEIKMSPQIRDLQQNAGEFFFISADFKKKKAGPLEVSGFQGGAKVKTKGQETEGGSLTPAPDPAAIELEFWRSIKDSTNPAMFEEFLRQFPDGRFSGLASLKLNELKRGPVASLRPPKTKPRPDINGQWRAKVTYDWQNAKYTETFTFGGDGDEVHGTASFLGRTRGILEGKVKKDKLQFITKIQEVAGDWDNPRDVVHRYKGNVFGDEIKFIMHTEGGFSEHIPIEFTAKKVP